MDTENNISTIDPKKVKSSLKADIIAQLVVSIFIIVPCCILFLLIFPNVNDVVLIISTFIAAAIVLFGIIGAIVGICMTKNTEVPPELELAKTLTISAQILIVVISIVISVSFYFIQDYINFVGYRSGDYSEYTCEDCDDAANGGAWLDDDFGNKYYCQFHYDAHKTALDKYKENHFDHDDSDILQIAEDTVKQNLKAPSTATFSSISETQIKRSGNTWTVSGWVDAQNSFGAMLRSEYTVKITFTSKTKYTIDSCIID